MTDQLIPTEAVCRCRDEQFHTHEVEYELEPCPGVGWTGWANAIARLLDQLAPQPTHCLELSQEPAGRGAQVTVGHHHIRAEASVDGGPWIGSWRIEQEIHDTVDLAELIVATLVTLLGFDLDEPILVRQIGAPHPCAACSWGHVHKVDGI